MKVIETKQNKTKSELENKWPQSFHMPQKYKYNNEKHAKTII